MINLAFFEKIVIIFVIVVLCFLLGTLKTENARLSKSLEYSKKTQNELLDLCKSQADTKERINNALFIHRSTEPSVNSFQNIVDELYRIK